MHCAKLTIRSNALKKSQAGNCQVSRRIVLSVNLSSMFFMTSDLNLECMVWSNSHLRFQLKADREYRLSIFSSSSISNYLPVKTWRIGGLFDSESYKEEELDIKTKRGSKVKFVPD